MRRVLPLMAAASLLALAACNKTSDATPDRQAAPSSAPAADGAAPAATKPDSASDSAAPAERTAATSPRAFPSAESLPPAPLLAMAYRLSFVLPTDQVRPLMESHQEACERAGPDQCQVMGAEAKSEGRDRESASLNLRATPAWMRSFRGRAEADVRDAGGKVKDSGTTGEDLSRPIADGEAAQKARAAEQARLRVLMDRRSRHLDDSLEVEQEITRVQQEIDAQNGDLVDLRGRVAMQTLTVDYQSSGMVAPDGVTAPVAQASKDFMAHMMAVFAALMNIASFLTPFVIIGAPIVWLVRRRQTPAKAPPAVPGQGG
jgi:hypothetical protein